MNQLSVLEKFSIYKTYKNWYVLEKDFKWDVKELYEKVFTYVKPDVKTPVIFCSTCDANRIVDMLGEEEEEFLWVPGGLYWREVQIIFVFRYDKYLPLIETLFHEFRHVWQDHDPEFKHHFDSDKKLSYEERVTEKDAFSFAKEKLKEYMRDNLT